tara:strand:- start:130 stop:288 length:159 start_codon:yes stop_codon:yes gene_type:complete
MIIIKKIIFAWLTISGYRHYVSNRKKISFVSKKFEILANINIETVKKEVLIR